MREIWKDIPGFEYYQVSNFGNIRSLDRYVQGKVGLRFLKGKLLKPRINKGAKFISLSKDKSKYYFIISRLVAKAFIPNPKNLEFVSFKNKNKMDVRAENLYWMSKREHEKIRTTKLSVNPKRLSGTSKKISATIEGKKKMFKSFSECERALNIPKSTITKYFKKVRVEGKYKKYNFQIQE